MQPRYQAIEVMLGNLPRGPAVDIGFGAGESLEVLARQGFAPLTGYELDVDAFTKGQQRMNDLGVSCQLWMKDATCLEEICDSSLALVHSRSAFQYFDFYELAGSVGRKLRVGGHLVAMIPSLHYYLQWKSYVFGTNEFAMWRWISYPRTVLRTLLIMAAGLQPRLGASVPEIAWTTGLVQRFALRAGMKTVSIRRRGWMLEVVLCKVASI